MGTDKFYVGDFLERDFEIKCFSSPEHHTLVALAVTSIIVYVVGVPAFLLYLLRRNRSALHDQTHDDHHKMLMKLGPLFLSFEEDYYFYEIVCILQKMLLVGALSVVEQYSPLQIFVGTLTCSAFMLLVLRTRPYKDGRLDQLSFLCSLCLSLTLLCGLVRAMDEHARGDVWLVETYYPGMYGKVLIALNSIPFAFCGLSVLFRWWRRQSEIKAELIGVERAIERKLHLKGSNSRENNNEEEGEKMIEKKEEEEKEKKKKKKKKKKKRVNVKVIPEDQSSDAFWDDLVKS